MFNRILLFVIVLIGFSFFSYSYTNISSCPYNITSSGEYRINDTLISNGTCIDVKVSNVSLDCQSNTITGNTTGSGIYFESTNITVRNCDIYNYSYNYYINSKNGNYIYDSIGNYANYYDLFILFANNNYVENFISKNHQSLTLSPINIVIGSENNILKGISIINNSYFNDISIEINSVNNHIIFSNLTNIQNISSVTGNYFYGNYFSSYSVVDGVASGNYFNYTYQGNNIGNYWGDMSCSDFEYRGEYPVCINPSNYTINSSSNLYDYAPFGNKIPIDYYYPTPGDKSKVKSENIIFKIRDIYNEVDNAKVYIDGIDYSMTRNGSFLIYNYTSVPTSKSDITFYVSYNSDSETLDTKTFTYFPDDTNVNLVPVFGFYSFLIFLLLIFGGLFLK